MSSRMAMTKQKQMTKHHSGDIIVYSQHNHKACNDISVHKRKKMENIV